jgi:hypothetical protein
MNPNFQEMMIEIVSAGWTQVEIASRLTRAQSWVSDIYRGEQKNLKFADAQALLALHSEVCASKEAAA